MNLDDALRVLVREHIGDFIYNIREHVFSDEPDFKGSSWEHPRVIAWNEACKAIVAHVKSLPS